MRTLCILALCALLTPASAFAGFKYRCVDAQGRSHYANDLKNLPPECRQRAAEEARQRAADEAAAKAEQKAAVRKGLQAALMAVKALRALDAVAAAEVTYESYVDQLDDVKRLVESSLADVKPDVFRAALREALECHSRAAEGWQAALRRKQEEVRRQWAEWRDKEAEWRRRGWVGTPLRPDERLIPVDMSAVRDGWLCAATKLALAEARLDSLEP